MEYLNATALIMADNYRAMSDVEIINNYCSSLTEVSATIVILCAIAVIVATLVRGSDNIIAHNIAFGCEIFYTIGFIYIAGIVAIKNFDYKILQKIIYVAIPAIIIVLIAMNHKRIIAGARKIRDRMNDIN